MVTEVFVSRVKDNFLMILAISIFFSFYLVYIKPFRSNLTNFNTGTLVIFMFLFIAWVLPRDF